jgi:DNA-binding IclR family transcriptional regulator
LNALRTVLGALEVMEYLGSHDSGPVRLTDISNDLKFPKTRIFRILSTLKQGKYVWQDPDTKAYSLSLRTWLLGRSTNVYSLLTSVVEPYVDELAIQSQETSIFAILDGLKMVHLYVSHTPNLVLAYVSNGSRVPLHASATGKAVLAKLGSTFISQNLPLELERFTSRTIVDREKLIREIENIQQVGYAVGADELSEGLSGAAAASVIDQQMICWAIGISGPTSRISDEKLQNLGKSVVSAVAAIEQKLNLGFN